MESSLNDHDQVGNTEGIRLLSGNSDTDGERLICSERGGLSANINITGRSSLWKVILSILMVELRQPLGEMV